jgi:hypothetical protein
MEIRLVGFDWYATASSHAYVIGFALVRGWRPIALPHAVRTLAVCQALLLRVHDALRRASLHGSRLARDQDEKTRDASCAILCPATPVMDAYRTAAVDASMQVSYVNAVMSGRGDAMEYFFERLPMPERPLPGAHLFHGVSPRVTISWRPTASDVILSRISREALAGAWRIAFDGDVLGYGFDEHVSWVREPSADEFSILRGARLIL